MNAFAHDFNLGYTSGMFNNMYSGFNMPCFNFFSNISFDPMMNFRSLGEYSQRMRQTNMPIFDFSSRTKFSIHNYNMQPFGNYTFNFAPRTFRNTFTYYSSNNKTKTKTQSASFYSGASGSDINRRVDTTCNLSAETLNKHLKGRGVLEGKGAVFLEAEKKYGVNAAFMVAICRLESGNGRSLAARNLNNVCGIKPNGVLKQFTSVDECIMYLGDLIANQKYYFKRGKKTIAEIGPVYCNAGWSNKVSTIMDEVQA